MTSIRPPCNYTGYTTGLYRSVTPYQPLNHHCLTLALIDYEKSSVSHPKASPVEFIVSSNYILSRGELYELLKEHPLAGLIGFFDVCDVEDVSTNITRHHAKQSN